MMLSVGPIPTPVVLLMVALMVAAVAGRRASRKGRETPIPMAGAFFDMLLVGLVAGRLVFVLEWLPLYLADPWSIIRIGDGGYSLWAAVAAGLGYGAWRARRRSELRRPLLWGSAAGLATWAVLAGALVLMQRAAVQLPQTQLTRIEGGNLRLADMAGQPMVVNLWATWCPPCRREMPVLAAGQAGNPSVTFVFVNQGESKDEVTDYLQQEGLQMHNVMLDSFSGVSQATGARAMPTTLFFDRDGRLVDTHMGELTGAGLAQKLKRFGKVAGPAGVAARESGS